METQPATTGGTDVAVPTDLSQFADIGMEDVDSSDMVMPTIKIVHKEALWQDNLSNEKFDVLDCVLLGLVKQRILWATVVEDDEPPLCRSYDHLTGFPDAKDSSRFPWSASGFAAADYPSGGITCGDCPLKEWGSHPNGKTPWCNEQHTYALLMKDATGEYTSPAVMTLQKTGIKPSKSYLSSFARAKSPLFVTSTNIRLIAQQRGQTDYAVPELSRGNPTDDANYAGYAETYHQIRDYLTAPRVYEDKDESTATEATTKAPAAAVSDDEMDF